MEKETSKKKKVITGADAGIVEPKKPTKKKGSKQVRTPKPVKE